ncbi:hypothetical protein ACIG3E_13760 [Streptomyces sp. NPDC053474]|uniref:hypothetical protein n=1 Tax=Streptomyces sp. NPDC053474 TaxID=3365704 RepID=UPI0037D7431B
MTEVVEAERRKSDLLVQLDELSCDVGGMEHLAALLGEDASGLRPGAHPLLAVLVLLGAVPIEGLYRVRVQRDGPRAGVGLGIVLVHLPTVHDKLLGDGDEPGVQIGVRPLLPACLAPPQPAEGNQVEQRLQAVLGDVVEEQAGVLRRPHHHREGA